MIIETHCHLDYLGLEKLQEILELSTQAKIQKIITIGVDPENLDKVKQISDDHEMIYYTQGIHPHDAKLATEIEFDKIATRSSEKKMVAVGEIGLDYHYDNSPRDIQKSVFEKQLQLSLDHNLPVVIHTREAEEDTMAILRNFPKIKGVVHSFTSSLELAEFVLGRNLFLGFNGIITFKNAVLKMSQIIFRMVLTTKKTLKFKIKNTPVYETAH